MTGQPARMPWGAVFCALGAIGIPVLCAGWMDGMTPRGLPQIAAAGALGGFFGLAMSGPVRAVLAVGLAWLAVTSRVEFGIDGRLVVLALAAFAGLEAKLFGGRAFTIALAVTVLLASADQAPPMLSAPSVLVMGLSTGFAGAIAYGAGLIGRLEQPRLGWRAATQLTLFLAAGMAIAITIARAQGMPEAVWLVQMFVFRALSPPTARHKSHLTFALGAVLGAAFAGVIGAAVLAPLALDQHPAVHAAIAALAFLLGLRHLPARGLMTPAMMSICAIGLMGGSTQSAVLRGEEALMIAALAIALTYGLDRLLGNRPFTA